MGKKAAMKGMKAMKAMKGMKAMNKVKRVSKIARGSQARSQVLKGRKEKTASGLTKEKLTKNKRGKIVSKKASANGKKAYGKIKAWTQAVQAARKALNITGFCLVNGNTAQGKALYKKAKEIA